MRRSAFLKHIHLLGEEELREELVVLFSKFDDVKKFYALELGTDEDRKRIYAQAKKVIASKYTTKSFKKPRRPRIQKVNSILSKLKNEAVFPFEMIDIYLFNVETAINFMRTYHFDSTSVRNSIETSFRKALELMVSERMEDEYQDRNLKILNTSNIPLELRYILTKHYNKNFSAK